MSYCKCEKCGKVVEDTELGSKMEQVSSDPPMYEPRACCPECGHEDFDDVLWCSVCGTYYYEDEGHECNT